MAYFGGLYGGYGLGLGHCLFHRIGHMALTILQDPEARWAQTHHLGNPVLTDVIDQNNKKIVFIEKQTVQVIAKIQKLIDSDEFLSTQMKLLKTVDGIGDKVAWKLLAELKFDEIEFMAEYHIDILDLINKGLAVAEWQRFLITKI